MTEEYCVQFTMRRNISIPGTHLSWVCGIIKQSRNFYIIVLDIHDFIPFMKSMSLEY